MSIIRHEQKFAADRDDADYLAKVGAEFAGRFTDGARQWAAIILREQGGLPWRMISEALAGCNAESSARSIYAAGIANLRRMLEGRSQHNGRTESAV